METIGADKSETHIHPANLDWSGNTYGMKTFITNLLQKKRVTNKKSLPLDVRNELNLGSSEDFDQNDISVRCTDE